MAKQNDDQGLDDERIEGTVALVLSKREILIDRGPDDNVEIGMRFVVLGSHEVTTSRSKVVQVEYPKSIVKIVRFQDGQHSVGRTFRTIKGTPGLSGGSTIGLFAGTPDRVETLRTQSTLRDDLPEGDMYVEEGDLVRETVGEEYFDV